MKLTSLIVLLLFLKTMAYAQPFSPVIWEKKAGPAGGEIADIEYETASGRLFAIAGSERRLFASFDSGNNWFRIPNSSGSFSYFNDIEIANNTIYVLTSYSLWTSNNGGNSFTEISTDNFDWGNGNRIIRLSSGRLVVMGNGHIHYSDNNGVAWSTGWSPTGFLNGSYLVRNSLDQIFVLKDQKPYISTNGGVDFNEFSTGIPPLSLVRSLAIDNSGTTVYCVSDDDIYAHNGAEWISVKGGDITDATISDNSSIGSFIQFTEDGLGMYFIDNANRKLYAKTAEGAASTWDLRQSSFPTSDGTVLSASGIDFPTINTAVAFFGSRLGVYKSSTGGASHSDTNTGITGISANQIEIDANGYIYLNIGFNEGVIRSTDNGNGWSKLSALTGQLYHFSQNLSKNVLYASTSDGRFRSYSQGSSWDLLTNLPQFAYALISADDDKVFAFTGNDFHYSPDQGDTWSLLAVTGLPPDRSINESTIFFASPGLMFFRLYDGGDDTNKLFKITITYSGSTISSAVASEITNSPIPVDNITKVFAGNGKLYVIDTSGSPDQLAVSVDNGDSWELKNLTTVNNSLFADNGYIFLIENSTRRIYISRDDGDVWQQTELSLPTQVSDVEDIQIAYDGKAYLAFYGDYLYSSKKTIVVPEAPSDPESVGTSATALAFRWSDNSAIENNFAIYQSVNGIDFTKIGETYEVCDTGIPRAFFVAPNLQPNTTYTFKITAENDAGSSIGTTIQLTTAAAACTQTIPDNRSWSAVNSGDSGFPIVAPQTVAIRHLGGGRYQVSDISLGTIPDSPHIVSFYENCGETFVAGGSNSDIKPNGNGTWNDIDVITLKWQACDVNEFETITYTLQPTDPAPLAPTGVLAYSFTNTSIEVNWQSGNYDKTYIIERSENGTDFAEVGTTTYPDTRFTDEGPLTEGLTYYYRIKALNGNSTPDESPYSVNTSVDFSKPVFTVPANSITNYVAATVGAYWADFNNDSFDDYLTMSFDPLTEQGTPIIFENQGNGVFSPTDLGLNNNTYFFAAVGGYDNDGNIDILLSSQENNVLDVYKGNGNFTFAKVVAGLGDLATVSGENIEMENVSLADINNDGLLDVMVLGSHPNSSDGVILLYKQNSTHSFTKIPGGELATDILRASASFWADYNNDGFQDVIITNTNGALRLYENNGDETFTKTTSNGFDATAAFSVAWGDYNNDGFMDIFSGGFTQHALYKNNGDETFTKDVSTSISEAGQIIAATWGDFNNDGYLDLITSGFGTTQTKLFMRDGSNPGNILFTKILSEKINDLSISHYGCTTADYDQNGYLDAGLSSFIFGTSDQVSATNVGLFENNISAGNWSLVKLMPTQGNKEGIGASISVTANGITQTRQLSTATAMVSRSSTLAHFGIGSATSITNVQVKWANGDIQNYPNPPINQVLVIDQDNTGPVFSSQTPLNNAIDVSTTSAITVTFNEPIVPVADKFLLVYINNDFSNLIEGIDVTDAQVSGNTYTFTLPQKLLTSTVYHIGIEAGAFLDIYGNPSPEFPSGDWTFTTSAGPQVSVLSPAHNTVDVPANTTLSITFDQTINAGAGAINLFKSTDLVNPVAILNAADGVISGQEVVFTLASNLDRATTYHISIDAGAFFSTAGENDFAGIASSAWSFTTDGGPGISTLSPVHNAAIVAVDAALVITFSEQPISPVAAKKIQVMNGATAIVDLDVSSNGTITNNTYTLPAPTGGWPFNTTLEVIVDAGAFTDADGNDFAGIAAGSWTFTTVDAPDVTAPGITFTPLSATLEKGFTAIAIEATVVDDKNVAFVNFRHRKISEQNFTALSMTFNNGTGKWEAQVPNSFVDDMGFEYFIEAYDGTNTGRLPLDNTTYFKSTITFTGANVPTLALPSGGTKNSWKIISVPHALPTSQIETIFSTLGTYDKTKWRLINYTETPSQAWVEYPTFLNIERGKGYFINTKDGGSITFTGATAPANTRDNLFTMNLAKGWNLVGNPYSVAVNWEDVRAYNPTKNIGGVKIFNSGTYSNGNELLVFQGGFVFMEDAATDIKIPFKGQTTPGGGRKGFNDLGTDIAAEEWALPVKLVQNELKYELGAVGMAKDASVSYDNYDDVTPPRFFDYLEMNFSHPEHFAKRFTRDIVPTQNNYTWDFTIDTNIQGYAELNWNNIPIISSSKDLFLLDISANRLINMKETGSYLFDPKVSANFRVYFGENLKIAPEQIHLGNAYPNPTSGYTTIAFSLPETGGTDQLVTLDIMDAMGRAVGKISEGRYDPGFHETGFDAKQLNNGFYTYRLTVQGKQGSSTQVNKLIIK